MTTNNHKLSVAFSTKIEVLVRSCFVPFLCAGLCVGCGGDDASPTTDGGTTGGGGEASELGTLRDWSCEIAATGAGGAAGASSETSDTDYLERVGCLSDFRALASVPLDASIPGARSVKVVLDRLDGNALYFQNSVKYKIHHDFASAFLSGANGVVPPLSEFNRTEYSVPDRRFILGAVTHYEQPDVWALEIAPYDTASAEMIQTLYETVEAAGYFGPRLQFHPTSESVELEAQALPASVPQVATEALFGDYQPLNLGSVVGFLRFIKVEDLENESEYVGFQDIVVLDRVPNDISVVLGLITEEFQTPLSHVNVLSQNRGTPNMGLKNATQNADLRAHEGKWVHLEVGAFDWSVSEATQAEADAFWETKKPDAIGVPSFDIAQTELKSIEDLVDLDAGLPLKDAIKTAVPAYGGKASHYSVLARIEGVPTPRAFAIPVHYYDAFMKQHGFYDVVDEILTIETPHERDAALADLRARMQEAEVDPSLLEAIADKITEINGECPDPTQATSQIMRFRSSTNAEDLDGFTGAGLYVSESGDPCDASLLVEDAVRTVWSSVWFFRAFEERRYRSIDHTRVGMALLVHQSFTEEEANGVALTGNIFDATGLDPAFYVNAQMGDVSVVLPPGGVYSDQFLYYYTQAGNPTKYLANSNLVLPGQHVLSNKQVNELGTALEALHEGFSAAYGPRAGNTGFYAMDVEFKFDGPFGEEARLFIKQARPHPGRGQ